MVSKETWEVEGVGSIAISAWYRHVLVLAMSLVLRVELSVSVLPELSGMIIVYYSIYVGERIGTLAFRFLGPVNLQPEYEDCTRYF